MKRSLLGCTIRSPFQLFLVSQSISFRYLGNIFFSLISKKKNEFLDIWDIQNWTGRKTVVEPGRIPKISKKKTKFVFCFWIIVYVLTGAKHDRSSKKSKEKTKKKVPFFSRFSHGTLHILSFCNFLFSLCDMNHT